MEVILDPRTQDEEPLTGLVEDLVEISEDNENPSKKLKLEKNLDEDNYNKLTSSLKDNLICLPRSMQT